MRPLILAGGGGHCLSVLDTVHRIGYYDEIIILDVAERVGGTVSKYTIWGTEASLPELYGKGCRDIMISVGSTTSTAVRRAIAEKIERCGFSFVNLFDPSAVISAEATLGKGIFIGKNAVVNAGVVIGDMAIINSGAIVEHNNFIGEYSHVSVGSVLCGDVEVGPDCLIGANATVLPGVHIGKNSIIGAGSLIYRDVSSGSKIYGGNR